MAPGGIRVPLSSRMWRHAAALALVVVVAALSPAGAAPGAGSSGFGNGGWYWLPYESTVDGIVPQRNGRIVVVYGQHADLVRLLPDGRPDVTFGRSGFVSGLPLPCQTSPCLAPQIIVQPDGKLVIAQRRVLSRRLLDGRLDRGFGTRGRVVVKAGLVSGLAIAPDGSIVAGLSVPDGSALLARYRRDGTPDARFGRAGTHTIEPRAPVRVAVQPDGKIVVAAPNILLSRYLPDGSIDESLGTHGILDVDGLNATALALQPDGKVVVAGVRPGGTTETVVVRLLPDGRFDQTFGSDGIVEHPY